MRFRMLTEEERESRKRERLSSWHKKFAWLPVRLTHDNNEVRWLQFVHRKGEFVYGEEDCWYNWSYAENEFDILRLPA